jgi:hypothetical protein
LNHVQIINFQIGKIGVSVWNFIISSGVRLSIPGVMYEMADMSSGEKGVPVMFDVKMNGMGSGVGIPSRTFNKVDKPSL